MARQVLETSTTWGVAAAAMNNNFSEADTNSANRVDPINYDVIIDTQFTSTNRRVIRTNTNPTNRFVPNNGAGISGISPALYRDNRIRGSAGDVLMITVECKMARFTETDALRHPMDAWIHTINDSDPNSSVHNRDTLVFRSGSYTNNICWTTIANVTDEWETNGARIVFLPYANADFWDFRFIIQKIYEASTT